MHLFAIVSLPDKGRFNDDKYAKYNFTDNSI